tara:strand:+ start:31446 stop:32606 length:1161 start_codon:yes stop_codon:yes gene_type:complete
MSEFLPFSLPEIDQNEIDEVVDTLRSGWITTGAKTKQFEKEFAEFIGGGVEALAVNSATAGLHLALEALGVSCGDEVIIPTYTFTATAEVVRYLGATPVLVDVIERTFNIDPNTIENAITPKTKVIIPVHFAGLACDMGRILAIAKKYGLKVVEDAAHALPTTYCQKMIGSLESDATVFSFYANKTMTTGEGGMIVTRHSTVADRCKIMRLHGISKDAFDRYSAKTPSWFYEVVAPGYKYNMTDIAASMGIHQLRKLSAFQEKREQMAQEYKFLLKDLPLILPVDANDGDIHARHLFPIILKGDEVKISRDEFISKLSEVGIGCSVHFIPLHVHPYWKESCNVTVGEFPVAQSLYENEVSIPLFTRMTKSDQLRVVAEIKAALSHG